MDFKKIEEMVNIFTQANVKSINIEDKTTKIFMEKIMEIKTPAKNIVEKIEKTKVVEQVKPAYIALKADSVGIFSAKVNIKDVTNNLTIKKGSPLFSITSMKLEHDKSHSKDCRILSFLVEDGSPVEYGQEVVHVIEV